MIPTPKTLEDFENREFSHEPHVYSSFAYLIGATRCAISAAAIVSPDVSCWDSSKIIAEADAITEYVVSKVVLSLLDVFREQISPGGE